MWRNDYNSPEQPTSECFIKEAIDIIVADYFVDFRFAIKHVRGFHGKGFVYVIYSHSGGHYKNGPILYGEDRGTYNTCLNTGMPVFLETQKEYWSSRMKVGL